jgi:DNA-binding NarL/FixJ family response regulator
MQNPRGHEEQVVPRTVRFLVVDDHPVFRQGLVALIRSDERYEVSGEAGSAEEAQARLAEAVPDVALVDISLTGQNGLDLVKALKAAHPRILILIISMHDEAVYAARALKAGARGYVMKQEAASVMLDAITTVLSGKIYVSSAMRDRLLETVFSDVAESGAPAVERLSDRELEVLEKIGQGYGAAEIARTLNLSVKTVSAYRDHIKEKLRIDAAGDLRRFAVKWVQSRDR